jgi:hypothetical protein
MEKTRLFILSALILITIMPLTSAIFVGQATSEPTIIDLFQSAETSEDDSDNTRDVPENRHSQLNAQREAEEKIEAELREVSYTDWICVTNKLQRTKTTLGHTNYEYGQACNITPEENQPNTNKFLTILSIFLGIFIILALILIILILVTK